MVLGSFVWWKWQHKWSPRNASKCSPSTPAPTTNQPHFHAQHAELVALVAQRLVAERQAPRADALLERVVQPQAVVPVAAADRQPVRLAVDVEVILAAIGEGLEPDRRAQGDRGAGGP